MQSKPALSAPRVLLTSPALHVGLSLALLCGATGCEWVLDGIPHAPQTVLGPDGSSPPGSWDAGPSGADTGLPSASDGGGIPPGADAGPVGPAVDGGPAAMPCVADSIVYRDIDGDGYGTGVPLRLTCPPAFAYASQPGDCDDGSADAFPGQTRYFGTPYKAADGSESFDYDCSGSEDGNGRQTVLGSCGLLGAAFCSGKGYAPTDRFAAFGVNSACGSTMVQECRAELFGTASCRATAGVPSEPYVCR